MLKLTEVVSSSGIDSVYNIWEFSFVRSSMQNMIYTLISFRQIIYETIVMTYL